MDDLRPAVKLEEIACAGCEREARVDVAEREGWGCWFGSEGELYAFCVDCFDEQRTSA